MIGAILILLTVTVAVGTASLVTWLNRRDDRRYVTHHVAMTGELPPRH